jgi:hypothetical protein
MHPAMPLLRALLTAGIAFWAMSSHANSLRLISGNFDAKNSVERTKVATEVFADMDRLSSMIQSPRPSESAWVEAEQSQISKIRDVEARNERISQLHKTPEFQQMKVHTHLQELRNALQCVAKDPPTLQREMFCWAVASYLLDETDVFSYGLKVLVSAKRLPEDLPKKLGVGSIEFVQFQSRWLSRGIQQYIVLPYLRGDLVR